ncbi:hypothetical protein QFZ63_003122 [Streptomyces sp. B3I7]|nr:hypothetical protein [Streptomyces sp. B3I7]
MNSPNCVIPPRCEPEPRHPVESVRPVGALLDRGADRLGPASAAGCRAAQAPLQGGILHGVPATPRRPRCRRFRRWEFRRWEFPRRFRQPPGDLTTLSSPVVPAMPSLPSGVRFAAMPARRRSHKARVREQPGGDAPAAVRGARAELPVRRVSAGDSSDRPPRDVQVTLLSASRPGNPVRLRAGPRRRSVCTSRPTAPAPMRPTARRLRPSRRVHADTRGSFSREPPPCRGGRSSASRIHRGCDALADLYAEAADELTQQIVLTGVGGLTGWRRGAVATERELQSGGSSFRRPRSEMDFELEWADHA